MKANALLISKETSDWNTTIAQAVSRAGLFLLQATDPKHAFELLRNGVGEFEFLQLRCLGPSLSQSSQTQRAQMFGRLRWLRVRFCNGRPSQRFFKLSAWT
jgi:hypothetical protein